MAHLEAPAVDRADRGRVGGVHLEMRHARFGPADKPRRARFAPGSERIDWSLPSTAAPGSLRDNVSRSERPVLSASRRRSHLDPSSPGICGSSCNLRPPS
jgi:hypothetical protein